MPRNNRSSEEPPEAMTLAKATPAIAIAIIFDLIRLFFEFLLFTGPALATIYCTAKVNDALTTWTVGLLGAKSAALACSAGVVGVIAGTTVITGGISAEAVEAIGVVMAMVAGLVGFLALGLLILMTNRRILKTVTSAPLQFVAGFGVSEIPLIGGLIPAFSIVTWRLYKAQIRVEKAARQKWEQEQSQTAAAELRERQQQAVRLMQAANDEQYEQQEEADEEYRQAEASNDEQYAQQKVA